MLPKHNTSMEYYRLSASAQDKLCTMYMMCMTNLCVYLERLDIVR
jgi:hypothetical protein